MIVRTHNIFSLLPLISFISNSLFPAILPARFVMQNCAESVLSISGSYPFEDVDPGYHMSPQGQTAVAKNYLNRIMQDHNIQVDKI
jgi:hypothetical protein